MRFVAEHHFRAAPGAVVDRLADPGFHLVLALPDLSLPELLGREEDGGTAVLRLRYEYTGQLDARARRLLGGHALRWVQELRVDRAAAAGSLQMAAESMPRALHARAHFSLSAASGGGAVRVLRGDLVVGVPVIGPAAERRIVPGVLARLDVEAQALDAAASG
jgi:hypothetical protein